MKMKTGTSMSSIINTRSKEHYAIMKKKDTQKRKRAKVCIDCKNNNDGFCNKHKNWCGKVNYICIEGAKNPYEPKKLPPIQNKAKSKKK